MPKSSERDAARIGDPQLLQVLTAEHQSLLSARSLAYNEGFTRAGIFLTYLSMSIVALALIGTPTSHDPTFLGIATILLASDLVIGLLTLIRIGACNVDDVRAMHGMNRIRHGYIRLVPAAAPYFVTGTHDDVDSVLDSYLPTANSSPLGDFTYGLSTSIGLVALIVVLVAGVLGAVVTLLFGGAMPVPLIVGTLVAVALFVAISVWVFRYAARAQASLPVAFPKPTADAKEVDPVV